MSRSDFITKRCRQRSVEQGRLARNRLGSRENRWNEFNGRAYQSAAMKVRSSNLGEVVRILNSFVGMKKAWPVVLRVTRNTDIELVWERIEASGYEVNKGSKRRELVVAGVAK